MQHLFFLGLLFSTSALAVKGMDDCPYGTKGCNSCVSDVPASFKHLRDVRSSRHKFLINPGGRGLKDVPGYPWRLFKDHIQSVTRLPGLEDENWVALTRNAGKLGGSGFFSPVSRTSRVTQAPWCTRR